MGNWNIRERKRIYAIDATDVYPILGRVGASLMMGINTTGLAEIVFGGFGVPLV